MNEYGEIEENYLRISVLSHPDEKVTQLIQNLVKKHPNHSTFESISVISVNVSTFLWKILKNQFKIILTQPVNQYFTEKLHERFYKSSGAIILFSDPDSLIAAKVFYQNYRKTAESSNPVAFVEIINSPNKLIINEPEILENSPNEAYYSIKNNDIDSFQRILELLVGQCFRKMH